MTEPYSVDDILAVIDRQMAEGALGYAALYDWRAVTRLPSGGGMRRNLNIHDGGLPS